MEKVGWLARWIGALNTINSQVWAFSMILTGCSACLLFHKAGLDIGIAAGIIGAGVNQFTQLAKNDNTALRPVLPAVPLDPSPQPPTK